RVLGLSGVDALSIRHRHACARVAGSVQCWGENLSGQTGSGVALAAQPSAGAVPSLGAVAQVAAGTSHTCALMSDTTVRCWGDNTFAQSTTGSASSTPTLVPVIIPNLSGVDEVACGDGSTIVRVAGTARCWGHADRGGCGDGDTSIHGLSNPTGVV